MVAVPNPSPEPSHGDQRLLLRGVTWSQYEQLLALFPDRPGLHITYLRGAVELVTHGPRHERRKVRLARLFEAWAEELEVDVEGYGGTTFRREQAERGLEPDGCYTIGRRPEDDEEMIDRPDIAIEVIVSNPLLDKLEVYAGLGIPEVWTWRAGAFIPHVLTKGTYVAAKRSALLPELDFELIARLAEEDSALDAVKTLRAELRARRSMD